LDGCGGGGFFDDLEHECFPWACPDLPQRLKPIAWVGFLWHG
jgi:hypothetical protein